MKIKHLVAVATAAVSFCAVPLLGCKETELSNQQKPSNEPKTTVTQTEWHDAFLLENLVNCYGTFDHYQMHIAEDSNGNHIGYYTSGIEFMGTMQMGVNGMSFLSDCFNAIPNQAEKYDNGEYNIIIIENENMYDLYLKDSKGGRIDEKMKKYSKEFTKEQYNEFLNQYFKEFTLFDILCDHYNDFEFDTANHKYLLKSAFVDNRTIMEHNRTRTENITFNNVSVSFKNGKIDVINVNASVMEHIEDVGYHPTDQDMEYTFTFESYDEQTIETPVLDD